MLDPLFDLVDDLTNKIQDLNLTPGQVISGIIIFLIILKPLQYITNKLNRLRFRMMYKFYPHPDVRAKFRLHITTSMHLRFPRWRKSNLDGTHDDRYKHGQTRHNEGSNLKLHTFTLVSKDPIAIYDALMGVRHSGAKTRAFGYERKMHPRGYVPEGYKGLHIEYFLRKLPADVAGVRTMKEYPNIYGTQDKNGRTAENPDKRYESTAKYKRETRRKY